MYYSKYIEVSSINILFFTAVNEICDATQDIDITTEAALNDFRAQNTQQSISIVRERSIEGSSTINKSIASTITMITPNSSDSIISESLASCTLSNLVASNTTTAMAEKRIPDMELITRNTQQNIGFNRERSIQGSSTINKSIASTITAPIQKSHDSTTPKPLAASLANLVSSIDLNFSESQYDNEIDNSLNVSLSTAESINKYFDELTSTRDINSGI